MSSSHLHATPLRLFTTTIILLGSALAWSVELAFGTPYLLSLGMDKAFTSLVWLAGPISGLLVNPYIGAMSDACTLQMGRRRPFLIIGTLGSLTSIALVALSRPLGGSSEENSSETGTHKHATQLTIWIAVFGFYILDFCINAVQVASRALIVDVMAPQDQAVANGIAVVMASFGKIVGYSSGLVDWPSIVGIQNTPAAQFQLVCSVACLIFAACATCTVLCTQEVPLPLVSPCQPLVTQKQSFVYTFLQPFIDVKRALPILPRTVIRVCKIQLIAWIGWFPILFYATTYVGQFTSNSHHPFEGPEAAHATRQGSLAFLAFSVVSLAVATILPWASKRLSIPLPIVWMVGEGLFAAVMMLGTFMVYSGPSATVVIALCGISWAIGTWIPTALLGETIASNSNDQASTIYEPVCRVNEHEENLAADADSEVLFSDDEGNSDICLQKMQPNLGGHDIDAVSQIPNASMSLNIDLDMQYQTDNLQGRSYSSADTLQFELGNQLPTIAKNTSHDIRQNHCRTQSWFRAPHTSNKPVLASGVVLGLHNVSVVVPQLVVSVFASGLFAILPNGKNSPMVSGAAEDSIGWLLRVGGFAAAISVIFIYRLLVHES